MKFPWSDYQGVYFNPGSTRMADPAAISHIVLTTNLAAAVGLVASTATAWIILGKPDLGMTINGCLAGPVAITAPCAYVGLGSSMIIGLFAGILVVFAVLFFDKVKLDDPVGAVAVHLANGVYGTICVGLFSHRTKLPVLPQVMACSSASASSY